LDALRLRERIEAKDVLDDVRSSVAFLVCWASVLFGAWSLRSQRAPAFTKEQADAGRERYAVSCARCHGDDLGGNAGAPALAGSSFMATRGSQTTLDLYRYSQGMPPEGPRLQADQYVSVLAYVLQQNGASAGSQAMTASTAVRIDTIATGQKPASDGR
jgi:mono/diheme cytochrome c family protein